MYSLLTENQYDQKYFEQKINPTYADTTTNISQIEYWYNDHVVAI